jgi:hypothetical protein
MLLLAVLLGCKAVDSIPEELDELTHWMWHAQSEGEDEAITAALDNLHAALGADRLAETVDGSVSRLSPAELELVGGGSGRPRDAVGVFMARSVRCELDHLEDVLTHKAQDELYEGVYDTYERTFLSPVQDFRDGTVDELSWRIAYTATVIGVTYSAKMMCGLRRVPHKGRSAYLNRCHQTEPADFDNDNKSMEQDHQLEVYWRQKSGELRHMYAIWREGDFGVGLTMDDEGVQRLTLNNMSAWDDGTEQLCEERRP